MIVVRARGLLLLLLLSVQPVLSGSCERLLPFGSPATDRAATPDLDGADRPRRERPAVPLPEVGPPLPTPDGTTVPLPPAEVGPPLPTPDGSTIPLPPADLRPPVGVEGGVPVGCRSGCGAGCCDQAKGHCAPGTIDPSACGTGGKMCMVCMATECLTNVFCFNGSCAGLVVPDGTPCSVGKCCLGVCCAACVGGVCS